MAIKRRGFLKGALGIAATLSAMITGYVTRIAPKRVTKALCGQAYPGPVEKLDKENIAKPGKWAG